MTRFLVVLAVAMAVPSGAAFASDGWWTEFESLSDLPAIEQRATPELIAAIDAEVQREMALEGPDEAREEPVEEEPAPMADGSGGGDGGGFKQAGVVYADGVRYTWYSQRVLPGDGLVELNGNGRCVDERGFVRDGESYIAVASSDHGIGEIVDTPFGLARVYDTGCPSGTIDVYTDF